MTVTLTKHIGDIYISFEGETAAEVVELYRGYRAIEALQGIEVTDWTDERYGENAGPHGEDDDGWIEWGGGNCPVPGNVQVECKFDNNDPPETASAVAWRWEHWGGGARNIVAYRVVSE